MKFVALAWILFYLTSLNTPLNTVTGIADQAKCEALRARIKKAVTVKESGCVDVTDIFPAPVADGHQQVPVK